MKDNIRTRLNQVEGRHEEIAMLLSQLEVMSDQNRFRDLVSVGETNNVVPVLYCRRATM